MRVLIDVSFSARQNALGVSTGVGRVIDEAVKRLVNVNGFDVRVTGYCANDLNPILTAQMVEAWAEAILGDRTIAMSGYRSRWGLSKFLGVLAIPLEMMLSTVAYRNRALVKVVETFLRPLRKVISYDSLPAIDEHSSDVYVFTFFASASELPDSLPRVAIVYDVYPLRFPADSGPGPVGNLRSLISSLSPQRDCVLAISEFTKLDFCNVSKFPPDRVAVGYLAVDQGFTPVEIDGKCDDVLHKLGISERPFFLTVANPQPRKNLKTAIEAFGRVASRMDSWNGVLVMVGSDRSDWGSEEIEAAIEELGPLKDRVIRTGPIDQDLLIKLYQKAIAFVFPSSFEGFGLPVLEAMSCGSPVIASNTTSIPEVGGDAAIYCDPVDVNAFADAMQRLLIDGQARVKLIETGMRHRARFSWDTFAEKLAETIRLAYRTNRID